MKILVVESPASRSREISEFVKNNNAIATRIDIKNHYDNIEEIQQFANELANAVVGADLVIAAYLEDIKDHADLIKKIIAGCAAIAECDRPARKIGAGSRDGAGRDRRTGRGIAREQGSAAPAPPRKVRELPSVRARPSSG